MNRRTFAAVLAVGFLSGCVVAPERSRTAGPDLTGGWTFEVSTGNAVTHGAMTLVADGQRYRGTLTTDQGDHVLDVRSLTLDGAAMLMVVDSPNGVVTFKGALSADARSFEGVVTYHNGQNYPMSGAKR